MFSISLPVGILQRQELFNKRLELDCRFRRAKRAEKQGVSASAQGAHGKPVYFNKLIKLIVYSVFTGLNS